jgi:hypothetical protein
VGFPFIVFRARSAHDRDLDVVKAALGRDRCGGQLRWGGFGDTIVSDDARSLFSAAEQGLGYIYQARFALLKLLNLPESNSIFIEKDDDVEFVDEGGGRSLASLKHKAIGETITDLSVDFWKSVRIWLAYYNREGKISSNSRFFLFTMLIRLTPKHTIGSLAAETRCRHARRCLAPRGSALSGFTARVPAPLS